MTKKQSPDALDREIKRRVRALEREIPLELESSVLERIDGIVPLPSKAPESPRGYRHWFYYGAVAAAATVLLMLLLFIYPLFNNRIDTVEAGEVWVQSARVEDSPASTFVINPKESGITIVWIEKIEDKLDDKKGGV